MNDSGGQLGGLRENFVAGVRNALPLRGEPNESLIAASLHLVSGLKDAPSEYWSEACERKDAERNGIVFLGSTNVHVRRFKFASCNAGVSATNCRGKREEDAPLSRISGLIKQSAGFPCDITEASNKRSASDLRLAFVFTVFRGRPSKSFTGVSRDKLLGLREA
jgi:hypothetical protein